MTATIPKSVMASGYTSLAFHFLKLSLRAPAEAGRALNIRTDFYLVAARLPARGIDILFRLVNGHEENSPALANLVERLAK